MRNNTYPLTPNDLINAGEGGRHEFTTWTAKAHGTYEAPWGVRVTPVLRHQSGQPFGRTFTTNRSQLRYATVTVLAEPVGTRRMDNVTLVDCASKSACRLTGAAARGVRRRLQRPQRESRAERDLVVGCVLPSAAEHRLAADRADRG